MATQFAEQRAFVIHGREQGTIAGSRSEFHCCFWKNTCSVLLRGTPSSSHTTIKDLSSYFALSHTQRGRKAMPMKGIEDLIVHLRLCSPHRATERVGACTLSTASLSYLSQGAHSNVTSSFGGETPPGSAQGTTPHQASHADIPPSSALPGKAYTYALASVHPYFKYRFRNPVPSSYLGRCSLGS